MSSNVAYSRLVLWQEFAPSDEELEAYRKGEEWDPKVAEQRRRLKVRLSVIFLLRHSASVNKTPHLIIPGWTSQRTHQSLFNTAQI